MTENRFKKGPYEDALQFAKDVLSSSSSIEEIIKNARIEEETEEEMNERLKNLQH